MTERRCQHLTGDEGTQFCVVAERLATENARLRRDLAHVRMVLTGQVNLLTNSLEDSGG